ncbi:MAG: hypothetical protein K6G64_04630 [Eubacterium sp.]|nr:hypothetical protein [Eubacterium sp.]
MNQQNKNKLKKFAYPVYIIYRKLINRKIQTNPKWLANRIFFQTFHRKIDWNHPKDVNEKINWLKFHENPFLWAKLADKYRVREYVSSCGLKDILIPLYGKWNSSEDVLKDWDTLPDEFVLKSNNGCGNILLITKQNGGKNAIDKEALRKTLDLWLSERDYGKNSAEPHYQLIQNCIIAEQLLKEESSLDFSSSMVDYKIWCFNGQPYSCLVVYDRKITEKNIHSIIMILSGISIQNI